MTQLQAFAVPTGGVIGLKLTTAVSGAVTLTRAISGASGLSSLTTLYSGSPLSETGETCFYLDIGDGTVGPLEGGKLYFYTLTDINGAATAGPMAPPSSVTLEEANYTQIVIAILQGACNTATLPEGVKRARVMNAMPLQGVPPLPMIFVNPEIVAQEEIPIGADDEHVGDLRQPATENVWTQTEQDHHMFRITCMSLNAAERDFYRTFIIATLRIAIAYAFSQFGADTKRSLEATSYQEVDSPQGMVPGFYAVDVLMSFTAVGNVKVTTSYGLIETILGTFTQIEFTGSAGPVEIKTINPTL